MPPASTLARRKATVAASARRRAPRLAPPAEEPRAIMAGYVSRLSGVVNALHSETLAALRDEGVRVDAADGDAPLQPGAAQRVEARLRRLAEKIVGDRKTIATIEGVGASVYRFSREQWSRQVKASLGIDLTSDPNLDELARVFRAENTKLIKSLCASHVERVRDVLMGAGSGERVENIMRDIREATGASKSRAALIARDQVLSLNGDVAEARHKDLGVTEYVWRTSKDERVRERHRELDGQRISYAEPPIVDKRTGRREHAGRDFQCRCTADPIIDLDALALKQPAPVPPQRPTAAPVAEAPPPVVSAAAPPRAFKLPPRPAAAPEPPRQPAPPAPPRAPAVDVPSAAKTLPPPAVAAAEPAPVFAIPPPPKVPLVAIEPEPLPMGPPSTPELALPPPKASTIPPPSFAAPKATAKPAAPPKRPRAPAAKVPQPKKAPPLPSTAAEPATPSLPPAPVDVEPPKPPPLPTPAAATETPASAAPEAAPPAAPEPPIAAATPDPVAVEPGKPTRRVVFNGPPPPPSEDDLATKKRSGDLLPKDTARSFSALPIKEEVEGIPMTLHTRVRRNYPENRIGDPDFAQHVADSTRDAFAAIPEDSVRALKRYTAHHYERINLFMRGDTKALTKKFTQDEIDAIPDTIAGVKEALAAAPLAPEEMVLFRGAKFENEKALDALAKAETFESPAFLSTSRNPAVAMSFSGGAAPTPSVVYRIRKHRTGAILSREHSFANEAEVLFPPGAKFKIVGRQRISKQKLLLDLEEIE